MSLCVITSKYVGKPWGKYSCIGLMHDFYKDLGADVPDSYDGISVETAVDEWRKRPAAAITAMINLFKTLGRPSDRKSPRRYDLLVLRRRGEVFPGIYLIGGMFLTSTPAEGVVTWKIGKDVYPIMARSLL